MHVHIQHGGDLVQGLDRGVGLLQLDQADLRALRLGAQGQLLLRNGQLGAAHLDIDREIGLHLVELNHGPRFAALPLTFNLFKWSMKPTYRS